MYAVDARDEVLSFEAVPIPSAGAPIPLILASENSLLVAYEVAPDGEQYAVLKFIRPYAHYFGSPNDETMMGHPLHGYSSARACCPRLSISGSIPFRFALFTVSCITLAVMRGRFALHF